MKRNFDEYNPKYTLSPMYHRWSEDYANEIKALKDFGIKSVVTNVPTKNGFVSNPDNLKLFKEICSELKRQNVEYWVYDECGYPSGQARGLTLKNHPEDASKVVYMRKFESYIEPLRFTYQIDYLSEKIVVACKYKLDIQSNTEAYIDFDSFELLPHKDREVEIDLKEGEIAYIYIIKDGYENTHCVHNCSSRMKYINILSSKAVKDFIDISYKPLVDTGVFEDAKAVFTDEPSLMIAYAREYEDSNYACIPFVDNLFEPFETKYSYDLKKNFVHLFENRDVKRAGQVRVDFYNLIGELVATNYTKQINDFLKQYNCQISGHYLGEENVYEHVLDYGSWVKVEMEAGYPGMDLLQALPYDFYYNVPKFLQMISRKKKTDGFMVEYCPFFKYDEFKTNPIENTYGSLSLLIMNGCRKIHSYFEPNMKSISSSYPEGSISKDDCCSLNKYISRSLSILEGHQQINRVGIYYALEDVQAKLKPRTCGDYSNDKLLTKLDDCLTGLANNILPSSGQYEFFDEEDTENLNYDLIIVPEIDFISSKTAKNLKKISDKSRIIFINNKPKYVLGDDIDLNFGSVFSLYDSSKLACRFISEFGIAEISDDIFLQHYDSNLLCVYNNNGNGFIRFLNPVTVYNPENGNVETIEPNKNISIKSNRMIFVEYM